MSLTAEQKAARLGKIGGSIAAQVLGVSRYGGPLEAYLQIRGLVEVEETEAMRWGTLLEEPIAQEWATKHKRSVFACDDSFTHPQYPWAVANPDRLLDGGREGLEVKNIGEWSARGLQGPTGVMEPLPDHLIQCVHYLAVLGYDRWHLACLVGGNRLVEFTIERDEKLIAAVMEREREFYEKHLVPAEPPPHTDALDPNGALAVLYPRHERPVLLSADETMRRACEALRVARSDLANAKRIAEWRAADVKALLRDAEGVEYEEGRITWRARKDGVRVFRPTFWAEKEEEEAA